MWATQIVAILALWASVSNAQHASELFEVGFARELAVPTQAQIDSLKVYLGGYGALGWRGPGPGWAVGIDKDSPIEANAFVAIDAAGEGIAFVSVDAIGMGNRLMQGIRDRVAAATSISEKSVFVHATHSHSGPDLQGLWGGVPVEYRDAVIAKASDAAIAAYRTRRKANLFTSSAPFPEANRNRRRFIDWTVNATIVLEARDAQTHVPFAAVVNYAAHPITLGAGVNVLSGDWPSFMRSAFEKETKIPCVFVNGAIGDVSPSGGDGRDFERAASYGALVAKRAAALLRSGAPVRGNISVTTSSLDVELQNPIIHTAIGAGLLKNFYNYDGDFSTGYSFPTRFAYWSVGSQRGNRLQGVTWPGESLTRLADAVRHHLPDHGMFMGLTSDSLGYFLPLDEWSDSGYEENVCMNKESGEKIRDSLIDMITKSERALTRATSKSAAGVLGALAKLRLNQ